MRALITALTLGLAALPASAQAAGRVVEYDASLEKDFRATVVELKDINLGFTALQLITEIDGVRHTSIVGTTAYLKEKGFTFAKGEIVTIRGVVTGRVEEGTFLSAREITKGEATLVLKNKQGVSIWLPEP